MTTHVNRRRSALHSAHHHPYARLYQALRAVQDLAEREHQGDAREWLLSNESEYAFATAGISPNSVRRQMI
jgi:hypothetical protein